MTAPPRTRALFRAALNNEVAEVWNLLLTEDPDQDDDDITPLWTACDHGHAEVVRLLLLAGADPDRPKRSTGSTPLWICAQNGHVDVIRLLLLEVGSEDVPAAAAAAAAAAAVPRRAAADPNKPRLDGATPAFAASQNGHEEALRLLLDAGAELDVLCGSGSTPLLFATQGGHVEVVRLLLARGASTELKGTHTGGITPLHYAAVTGNVAITEDLLTHGASANVPRTVRKHTIICAAPYRLVHLHAACAQRRIAAPFVTASSLLTLRGGSIFRANMAITLNNNDACRHRLMRAGYRCKHHWWSPQCAQPRMAPARCRRC